MDERILKYFQNELDIAERLKLLREIEKDDILKKQFSEYQNIRALMNLSSYMENVEEGKVKYSHFTQWVLNRKRHQYLFKLMKYAAAVVLLIVSTCWLTLWTSSRLSNDNLITETNTLYVPAGQRACITLQDGSVVWLNAQSTLIYPSHFWGTERKVQIIGEAFFEIAKNEKKPFYVVAQNVEMRVLGTKFNVYSYPETGLTRTSLIEGAVQVSCDDGSEKVILKPNEQVTVRNGQMTVDLIEFPDALLWKEGIYSFNNERLIDITKKLELYYDVKIVVSSQQLGDIRYTCKFRQRDGIDEILKVIQQIHHFKINKDKEKNTFTLN